MQQSLFHAHTIVYSPLHACPFTGVDLTPYALANHTHSLSHRAPQGLTNLSIIIFGLYFFIVQDICISLSNVVKYGYSTALVYIDNAQL